MRVLIAIAVVVSLAPSARAETYRVLPDKSRLVGRLFRDGVAARLAHDHVILGRGVEGTIELDLRRPERTRIEVTVPARRLEPDPPGLRKRYGMEPLAADDVAKIRRNMHAVSQLFVARHPEIRFVSSSVQPMGEDRYRVRGTFTLRGVKREVSFVARVRLEGDTLRGSGQLRFKQSAFGFAPYSAALGLIKVKDAALVDIYVEARRPRR